MVHSVDQCKVLVYITGPPPVIDRIVDKILIYQTDDRCLFGRKLTINELDLRFLEHLGQLLNWSKGDIHPT